MSVYNSKERAQKAAELIREGKYDNEATVAVGYKNLAALLYGLNYYLETSPAKIRKEAKNPAPPVSPTVSMPEFIADVLPPDFVKVTFIPKSMISLSVNRKDILLSVEALRAIGSPRTVDMLVNKPKKRVAFIPGSDIHLCYGRSKRADVMEAVRDALDLMNGKLHGTKVGNMIIFGE